MQDQKTAQKSANFFQYFPWHKYPGPTINQKEALHILSSEKGSVTLELPTGTGKTAVGYTFLKTLEVRGEGPLFYIVPTKTLVDQVKSLHPDLRVAYGRHEYDCLYYEPDEQYKADEIPCLMLTDCPHRVDQETGLTHEAGAAVCPYYQAKYEAKQSGIVVCTMAFYLFTQLFSKEWQRPAGLVIDEAHRIADVVRSLLSYDITDWHLKRVIEILEQAVFGTALEVKALKSFLRRMVRFAKRRSAKTFALLGEHEIRELMQDLMKVNPDKLKRKIERAIASGRIDPKEQREDLKQLEIIVYDLRRYIHSFEYSLPTDTRHPLNYTVAFYKKELSRREKVKYRLTIKAYHVASLIKKRLLAERTLAYSATIGDPEVFGFESGIDFPFYSLPSDFPVENTRIFMPVDTPNLAVKSRSKKEPTKVLRTIAKACKTLSTSGIRSMVVVVSEFERSKFLWLCEDEGVSAISYGDEVVAREAAARFKKGEGDVLVGTEANYGEGVDLPRMIAPVIFFLRPGYPSPTDPLTQFEERRYGRQRWKVWNWRVMISALQVRGRNVRSDEDLGVTVFVSQQFRRFLFASMPPWLQGAYRGEQSFEECMDETTQILSRRMR